MLITFKQMNIAMHMQLKYDIIEKKLSTRFYDSEGLSLHLFPFKTRHVRFIYIKTKTCLLPPKRLHVVGKS